MADIELTKEEIDILEKELSEISDTKMDGFGSPTPKFPLPIRITDTWVLIDFYYKNNIPIKFRLIHRQEYQFEGIIKGYANNKGCVIIILDNQSLLITPIGYIDPTTICPKSCNPFIGGIRIQLPDSIKEKIFKRDGYVCQYKFDSNCLINKDLTIDHIHPIALGGTNSEDNLITCCRYCNSKKWKKNIVDMY